jgi:hypothetical protein
MGLDESFRDVESQADATLLGSGAFCLGEAPEETSEVVGTDATSMVDDRYLGGTVRRMEEASGCGFHRESTSRRCREDS